MVFDRFSAKVSSDYTDELNASIYGAYGVNQAQQKAGSSTSDNEYPFGQGNPYGK